MGALLGLNKSNRVRLAEPDDKRKCSQTKSATFNFRLNLTQFAESV